MKGHGGHEPWLVCPVCDLSAPDVTAAGCPDSARCRRVLRGESLGGQVWPVTKVDIDALPEPPEAAPLVVEEEPAEAEPKLVLLTA